MTNKQKQLAIQMAQSGATEAKIYNKASRSGIPDAVMKVEGNRIKFWKGVASSRAADSVARIDGDQIKFYDGKSVASSTAPSSVATLKRPQPEPQKTKQPSHSERRPQSP